MNLKTFDEMNKSFAFFLLRPAKACYAFILTVCITIAVLVVWSGFAPMDDVVKASVFLRTEEAVSEVRCLASGELCEKKYVNNQLVNTGDFLLQLDTEALEKELQAYQLQLEAVTSDITINDVLMQTIKTEDNAALKIFQAESQPRQQAEAISAAYLYELNKRKNEYDELQIKLQREKDKPAALRVQQNVLDMENQCNQCFLSLQSFKNSEFLKAIETQKQLVASKISLESQIAELNRNIKNATITAPITGRIIEVKKLNNGDYILAGEELFKLVPNDAEKLKAYLYVDSAYIARVKTGNPVKIKFPGLPPSRFGQVETEVSVVPPDAEINNGEAYFAVEALLDKAYLEASDGQVAKLLPGITAEGRIITERSTILKMLLRKLDFIR